MIPRALGRDGPLVSPLGFGAFKIGRNRGIKYEHGYELPDDDDVATLLDRVLELGITLIDTAPAYGTSEERLGRHLSGRRAEFTLSTKVGETFDEDGSRYAYDAASVRTSIERSLRRLRTDRLDVVFVHSNGDDSAIIEETAVLETLQEAKRRGDVGLVGFSGKTVAGHDVLLDRAAAGRDDGVDCLMIEFHRHDESQRAVIDRAFALGVGVIVKKGLAAGRLDPADALPFCLDPPGVASVVVGGLDITHIEANVRIVSALDAG